MTLASLYSPRRPLVLVGAGKMGGAMLSAWLERGLAPASVRVIDPGPPPDSAAVLKRAGIVASAAMPEGIDAGAVVLAVKPQMMGDVLPRLRPLVMPETLVLSIAAGTRLATLREAFGAGAIVRSMPNTPAQIGQGISVAVGRADVGDSAREQATALLAAVGAVEWVHDEGLMDAVTAVSGSGPAYVFLLAESLAEAGVAAGLPAELAARLANTTVAGSGGLLARAGLPPDELRRNVTSKGGTTAAALDVLMAADGLSPLMKKAVAAAKKRAGELG